MAGAYVASGVDEVDGVQELPAFVALVTPGVLVTAPGRRAMPLHQPVCQKPLVGFAVRLGGDGGGGVTSTIHGRRVRHITRVVGSEKSGKAMNEYGNSLLLLKGTVSEY